MTDTVPHFVFAKPGQNVRRRVQANPLIVIQKPTLKANHLSSASDPILAVASAPFDILGPALAPIGEAKTTRAMRRRK